MQQPGPLSPRGDSPTTRKRQLLTRPWFPPPSRIPPHVCPAVHRKGARPADPDKLARSSSERQGLTGNLCSWRARARAHCRPPEAKDPPHSLSRQPSSAPVRRPAGFDAAPTPNQAMRCITDHAFRHDALQQARDDRPWDYSASSSSVPLGAAAGPANAASRRLVSAVSHLRSRGRLTPVTPCPYIYPHRIVEYGTHQLRIYLISRCWAPAA